MLDAKGVAGADTITFDIPLDGEQSSSPFKDLLAITDKAATDRKSLARNVDSPVIEWSDVTPRRFVPAGHSLRFRRRLRPAAV